MAVMSPEDELVLRHISSIEPLLDSPRTLDDAAASIRCAPDVIAASIERLLTAGLLVREQVAGEADSLTGSRPQSLRLTLAGRRTLDSSA